MTPPPLLTSPADRRRRAAGVTLSYGTSNTPVPRGGRRPGSGRKKKYQPPQQLALHLVSEKRASHLDGVRKGGRGGVRKEAGRKKKEPRVALTPEQREQRARSYYTLTKPLRIQKIRTAHRRRMYGLSPEAFQRLLSESGGRCPICVETFDLPHVDHCHQTKKVRGLLCGECNRGLGQFRDDPARCLRAAAYLERARGATLVESAG
jgi:hypothetical protein